MSATWSAATSPTTAAVRCEVHGVRSLLERVHGETACAVEPDLVAVDRGVVEQDLEQWAAGAVAGDAEYAFRHVLDWLATGAWKRAVTRFTS